jgi:phosphomannomutase
MTVMKPLSLKISVSGVRGIVGESLTPQLVTSFAAAFGTYCGTGPVAIGTDTRPSREMVTQAAVAGLLSVGCAPVSLGIVPAPVLQHSVRRIGAAGGICITASHNPAEWNALKFFGPDGIVLRPNQFAELTDLYHQGVYPRIGALEIPEVREDSSAVARHRQSVLAAVDVEAIRSRRFKAAVDCCNGAAFRATPEFLRSLGCDVVEIHTDPAAPFPRDPEPLPENLGVLCRAVREAGCDIGFAQDADADRLTIADERGVALVEDCTLALSARHALARRPGPMVASVSTSRIVTDAARERGCEVHGAKVGEINVIERMLEVGARFGGEGNGGVIDLDVNPCRDSFVAMALVLEALTIEGGTVSEMRRRLPTYAMVKVKVPCRARDIAPCLRLVARMHADVPADRTDGVKVLWPDRWLHVRGSTTEPVLRVTAESPAEEDARALVLEVLEAIRPIVR